MNWAGKGNKLRVPWDGYSLDYLLNRKWNKKSPWHGTRGLFLRLYFSLLEEYFLNVYGLILKKDFKGSKVSLIVAKIQVGTKFSFKVHFFN